MRENFRHFDTGFDTNGARVDRRRECKKPEKAGKTGKTEADPIERENGKYVEIIAKCRYFDNKHRPGFLFLSASGPYNQPQQAGGNPAGKHSRPPVTGERERWRWRRVDTLEAYVLWNFAMDLLVCMTAARSCAREKWLPGLAAAGLGVLYALLQQWGAPGGWALHALAGMTMALVAVRPDSFRLAARAVSALWAASLFCAGAQLLATQSLGSSLAGAFAGAVAGAGMYGWLGRTRQMRLNTWDVMLFLCTRSGCVRFRALVDTGNRLHEPLSGLPVMIVEEKALRRALPEGFDARTAAQRPPEGWRLVAYGVLGGAGRMACFRPERLLVSYGGKWLLAPDIWVAAYPGRIPGQVAALAPTVIGTIQPTRTHVRQGRQRGIG